MSFQASREHDNSHNGWIRGCIQIFWDSACSRAHKLTWLVDLRQELTSRVHCPSRRPMNMLSLRIFGYILVQPRISWPKHLATETFRDRKASTHRELIDYFSLVDIGCGGYGDILFALKVRFSFAGSRQPQESLARVDEQNHSDEWWNHDRQLRAHRQGKTQRGSWRFWHRWNHRRGGFWFYQPDWSGVINHRSGTCDESCSEAEGHFGWWLFRDSGACCEIGAIWTFPGWPWPSATMMFASGANGFAIQGSDHPDVVLLDGQKAWTALEISWSKFPGLETPTWSIALENC